ncbi:putative phosphoesterase [Salinimicrobium catena]|uniref:Putative phosphoesterase n=1 Tax=Salinimicrobium catena TaxID=390640 RepID=A0A1H5HVV3_9FLAO|nr:ligase-associated DNA damage response endonuclease PdeM [Salinimicrobium catena]SDK73222.1 putative phosphoesterase [Salinimicrobium catena]SEE32039.1 putative phosphoesterase [Salinimicrobium catena]
MTKSITIFEQNFILHYSGALFWEEEDMLLISDVHLGKVSHFRKFGSAVPQSAVQGNFLKLTEVVEFFQPSKIVFLGDLFHSSLNKEWLFFEAWMDNITSEVILVEGNHDIISPLKYEALGVKLFPEIILKNFLLTHHPEERSGFFNFSGHIHPGVRINGLARQSLKLPCFFKNENQMILPAFGEFTGKHILHPKERNEVYVLANEEVILLK